MSCITTYTGKHFDPTDPDPTLFDIRDIAHSLSLTCRGNGHVKTFFSVASHCVNCATEAELRGYSPRVCLACLIHDASEAYMSDVPRPFKHALPEYIKAEEKILELIYEHFLGSPITRRESEIIKRIDDDMLYFDLRELLNETGEDEPAINIKLSYDFVPFAEVEAKYLELFNKYKRLCEEVK